MIAEVVKSLRILSRPLRRQFWWPAPKNEDTEKPGVVLVSFDHLKEWEHRKIRNSLSHYVTIQLSDSEIPRDHTCEHQEPEPTWASVYRAFILCIRTVTSAWRLFSRRTSWAQHLCESDDLARLHLQVMWNKCYVHIGTLHTKRVSVLRRIRGFISSMEWRHYEIWVIVRDQRVAYLPASLHLPEAPLQVKEIVQMARRRPEFEPATVSARKMPRAAGVIRIMSYNLHSCIGLDGRVSVRRIAEVLHLYDPDFVAIQEIDVGCRRSAGKDQLKRLQELWPAQGEFFPLVKMRGGLYGIAYLSRLPVVESKTSLLPSADQMLPQEARGVQTVKVELPGGKTLEILNTHLGLTPKERMAQLRGLMKLTRPGDHPTILTGDFNCKPKSREYRFVARSWRPTQVRPLKTWFGTFPLRHLDYSFVKGAIEVVGTFVPRDSVSRMASDHLPLITDLKIE